MERIGKFVSTREILGNFRETPLGRPSSCPTCGAESEILQSPGGFLYYQLRCECQRARVAASAKHAFDAAISTWSSAVNRIAVLESQPAKERDEGTLAQAWGMARRAAREALEYSQAFGFALPRPLDAWGRRVYGGGWG